MPSLFDDAAVFLAAFLGGPLGGVALLSLNYRALGDAVRSRKTLVLGLVLLVETARGAGAR